MGIQWRDLVWLNFLDFWQIRLVCAVTSGNQRGESNKKKSSVWDDRLDKLQICGFLLLLLYTKAWSNSIWMKLKKPRPKLPQHERFKLDGDRYQQEWKFLLFRLKSTYLKVSLNVSIARYWLKIVASKRRHFNFHPQSLMLWYFWLWLFWFYSDCPWPCCEVYK